MATRKQEPPPKQQQARTPAKAPARGNGSRGRTPTTTNKRPSAKSSNKKTRPGLSIRLNLHQKAILGGLVLCITTLLLSISLLSPNKGKIPGEIANLVWQGFGWGGIFVLITLLISGFYLILWGMEQPPRLPTYRLIGLGGLFLTFEALATFIAVAQRAPFGDAWTVAAEGFGGGYLGAMLVATLQDVIGLGVALLLYLVVGAISTILLTGLTKTDILNTLSSLRERAPELTFATGQPRPQTPTSSRASLRPSSGQPVQPPLSFDRAAQASAPAPTPTATAAPTEAKERGRGNRPAPTPSRPAPPPAKPATVEEASAPQPIFVGQAAAQNWKLPALAEMLEVGSEQNANNDHIREQVAIIEKTLESFGAPVKLVDTQFGPTVIQYGVEPLFIEQRSGKRTKVKVGKIASLADDLSLALSARSIRIQAPVPGKGYVGIEVPNMAKSVVSLRDVMESAAFQKIKSPLAIGLGQDVAGQAVAADLTKMPHLLIAGATGSGKSVCVNGIIACLILQNTPDDLKLVMVDPKRVELTGYNGIPHLAAPVVVDLERVVGTLQWALREMDKRYKAFSSSGVRNIQEYNKKLLKEKGEKLPYIVIIIDELADLMMLAPEETERGITRLAQMARATGIHMILATQRPSVDVVTGLIKANFPARIAFAVASSTDSRVILDSVGAERLLGQGDMLFQSPDAAAPLRLQGCYVGDAELDKLIAYWQRSRRSNLITPETHAQAKSPVTTLHSPLSTSASPRPPLASSPTPPPIINTDPKAVPPAATFSTTRPVDPEPRWLPAKPTTTKASQPSASQPSASQPSAGQPVSRQPETKPTTSPLTPPPSPSAHPQAQQPLWEELIAQEEAAKYEDELLPEAIAMVREMKKASTSLLQRRFRIGYTRAARLIDLMEEQGIIGPPTGTSKARDVVGLGAEESAAAPSTSRTKMGGDALDDDLEIEFDADE